MEGCHEDGVAVVVGDPEEDSRYKACSDGVWGRCGHGRYVPCHEGGVAVVVGDPEEDSPYKSGVSCEGCGHGMLCGVAVVVGDPEEDSPYKACSGDVWGRCGHGSLLSRWCDYGGRRPRGGQSIQVRCVL